MIAGSRAGASSSGGGPHGLSPFFVCAGASGVLCVESLASSADQGSVNRDRACGSSSGGVDHAEDARRACRDRGRIVLCANQFGPDAAARGSEEVNRRSQQGWRDSRHRHGPERKCRRRDFAEGRRSRIDPTRDARNKEAAAANKAGSIPASEAQMQSPKK
jgi:hypothetical protein